MLKGLRRHAALGVDGVQRLTGFPDVEGIETHGSGVPARRFRLTGFPDVEGIET